MKQHADLIKTNVTAFLALAASSTDRIQAWLQIILLVLSIIYTAKKLLFPKKSREQDDSDPEAFRRD